MENERMPANVGSNGGLGLAPERAVPPTPQNLRDYAQDADDHGNKWVPMSPQSLRALAAEMERLEPMDMALCERHSLVLRVGVAYVFRPVGDCPRCAEMVAQAREAYGPGLGA